MSEPTVITTMILVFGGGYVLGVTLGILACMDGVMRATKGRFPSKLAALKWVLLAAWKEEAEA